MTDSIAPRIPFGRTKLVKILVSLFAFGSLGVILFPACGCGGKQSAQRSQCQSNLKQILLSVRQYAADYDEKLPLVSVEPRASFEKTTHVPAFGWADALYPYRLSPQIFQCPAEKTTPAANQIPRFQTEDSENQKAVVLAADKTPLQVQYTDYWFNALASGASERQIQEPTLTIVSGDGNDGADVTNARYHLWKIPNAWRKNEESPLYRHRGGANYAFADGHVKWRNSSSWKNELGMQNGATLLLQAMNQEVSR